jgi:hypothetical protein
MPNMEAKGRLPRTFDLIRGSPVGSWRSPKCPRWRLISHADFGRIPAPQHRPQFQNGKSGWTVLIARLLFSR